MNQVEAVIAAEEQRWREEFQYPIRSGAYGGNALHLPDETGKKPLCSNVSREEWQQKRWEQFPQGHAEICKLCAFRQRNRE